MLLLRVILHVLLLLVKHTNDEPFKRKSKRLSKTKLSVSKTRRKAQKCRNTFNVLKNKLMTALPKRLATNQVLRSHFHIYNYLCCFLVCLACREDGLTFSFINDLFSILLRILELFTIMIHVLKYTCIQPQKRTEDEDKFDPLFKAVTTKKNTVDAVWTESSLGFDAFTLSSNPLVVSVILTVLSFSVALPLFLFRACSFVLVHFYFQQGVDPKSVLCQYFKAGHCRRGKAVCCGCVVISRLVYT